jgi:hypothetical protein
MHDKCHPASDVASLSEHRTALAGDKSSKGYSSRSDHSDDEDNLAVAISASPPCKRAKRDVLPPKRKLTIAMSESDEDTDDDGNNSTEQRG